VRPCPPGRPAASAGRQRPGGSLVDLAEVGGIPVHLDHPGRAHRAAQQRNLEQLMHGQDPQRQRQRPQVRHRVQVGLVIGHHDVGGGRLDMLKAIHHHSRPRRSQPHRRPPPHHPVSDGRVGPGGSAELHQRGASQRRQHARDERRHRPPSHPSTLPVPTRVQRRDARPHDAATASRQPATRPAFPHAQAAASDIRARCCLAARNSCCPGQDRPRRDPGRRARLCVGRQVHADQPLCIVVADRTLPAKAAPNERISRVVRLSSCHGL